MMFAVHRCGFCGALPPIASVDGPFHPFIGTSEDGDSAPVCATCAEDVRREQGGQS